MAAPSSKIEFTVQMTCKSCVKAIQNALEGQDGISNIAISLENESVVVDSLLPSEKVKDIIESTGRRAVLKGLGSTKGNHLGAAVAMMDGEQAKGVIRYIQVDQDTCIVEGTLDGLKPGKHSLNVHEFGDISAGCESCGDVLGYDVEPENPVGKMTVIDADDTGRASFRFKNNNLKVWEMIGRSTVIHSDPDLRRLADNTRNFKCRTACGIIARSAGLFENSKRICACDGVTLWDERDRPLAGPDRSQQYTQSNL